MNDQLIENLKILIKYYSITKDHFRRTAYEKALKIIKNLDFQITDINQVKKTKGIGKSTLEKINEYLNTGMIKKVEEIKLILEPEKTTKEIVIEMFLKIWGVGEVKANSLWEKGYRSIEDIIKEPKVLNRLQLIGLKYYDDLQLKIPRMNVTVIQVIIRFILNKTFGKDTYTLIVAGSYRRGKAYSNDIDILLTSKFFTLKDTVDVLQKWNVISDVLSFQKEKFMGVAHCPKGNEPYFRLDIEFLPEEEFAFGLLYFTGSKDFNKEIRWHAKKLGYTLNQHGLKTSEGKFIRANTEEEIFELLDLEYVKPIKRL
jgi:DNA polymerase/3'-5' exonuclease PolX